MKTFPDFCPIVHSSKWNSQAKDGIWRSNIAVRGSIGQATYHHGSRADQANPGSASPMEGGDFVGHVRVLAYWFHMRLTVVIGGR
jgi:hypothetical protein